ncbi:MAG: hypothetical protein J6T39_01955 [Clostridia bacterium]|nr:hypothetical protein [Clostridia bacterium]
MENRKYIVLKPTVINQNAGGIVIISESTDKTNCYVSLFGVEPTENIFMFDDLISVRQFEMKHKVAEFEIEKLFSDFSDFVVGIFNQNKKLILTGSTIGIESREQKERLEIALENKNAISHFGNIAREMISKQNKSRTFLDQTITLLLDLFSFGVPDAQISKLIPNSKWVKVFSTKEVVGVGILEKDNKIYAIGLAFPVINKEYKRKEIDDSFCFMPLNKNLPNGFGYYVVFQSAKDGSVIPFEPKKC